MGELYEPKSKGFKQIPEGWTPARILQWDLDRNYETAKKIKGWKFTIIWNFYESGDTNATCWLYSSSDFGKWQITTLCNALRLDFSIPDKDSFTDENKPRRDYTNSIIDKLTDEVKWDALEYKVCLVYVQHQVKCPNCKWTVKRNKKCSGCGEELTQDLTIYSGIDNAQGFMPLAPVMKKENSKSIQSPQPNEEITAEEPKEDKIPF